MVFELAPDGTVQAANPNAERLLDKKKEELVGKHITEIISLRANPHVDHEKALRELAKTPAGEARVHDLQTTVQLSGKRGKPLEAYLRYFAYMPRAKGKPPALFVILTHTEPILKESRLFEHVEEINKTINAHENLQNILSKATSSVGEMMRAACLIATVATPEDARKYPDIQPGKELVIRAGHGLDLADFAPYTRLEFGKGLMGTAAARKEFTRVRNMQEYPSSVGPGLDKKYNFKDAIAIPLLASGQEGEKPTLVGVLSVYKHGPYAEEEFEDHEVTLLRHLAENAATKIHQTQLADRLKHLADYDEMTGIFNRGKFFRNLREYLKPKKDGGQVPTHSLPEGSAFGIVYADADNLKRLNDVFNHSEGNHGIRSLAHALQEAVTAAGMENKAVVARLGGDEFAVLLPGASAEKTKEVEEHFHRILRKIVSENPKFREAGFGASTAHTAFVTEGKSEGNVYNLGDLPEKFREWKEVNEDHYLDGVLSVPEEKAMAAKTRAKRESGYIGNAALRELAHRMKQNPHINEEELLTLLEPHANLEIYHAERRKIERKP